MAKNPILDMVDALSNARGISKEIVFQALEDALKAQAIKHYKEEADIRVEINHDTGEYHTYRCWGVISDEEIDEEAFDPATQIRLSDAQEEDPELQEGDVIQELVESIPVGRIAAQQTKQFLTQRMREAERDKVSERFSNQIGEIFHAVVKRVERERIVLDLRDNTEGVVEGIIPKNQLIPREPMHMGDRIKAYFYAINKDRRGPQLMLSRTHPEFLMKLFTVEVPEIGEQVIEIKAVARDPGSRAKIAVKTNDGRIDPVGACVGMRGGRVQAVSNELNGERIDIILWDDNPAQLAANALAPAEIVSIVVDEDKKSMDVAVSEEQLSQAIGRSGQNVKLASTLTGWTLNVMSEAEAEKKTTEEGEEISKLFTDTLSIDKEVADILVGEGFTSIEEIAFGEEAALERIVEFDENLITALRDRASTALLAKELEEELSGQTPSQDLIDLEGIDEALGNELARKGITTREELAEQSVDELLELIDIDEKLAAELIMKAREHWFEE